jgi:hypothetical protein
MAVWWFYQAWWLLPSFGLLLGYATNLVALKMIFNPKRPWRIGPFRVQGLFFKRQQEVAHDYGNLVADEILTTGNIYGTTVELLNVPLKEHNITPIFSNLKDLKAVKQQLQEDPAIKMIYVESPTNPTIEVYNLKELAELAHIHDYHLAVGNPFSSPCLQRSGSILVTTGRSTHHTCTTAPIKPTKPGTTTAFSSATPTTEPITIATTTTTPTTHPRRVRFMATVSR